MGVNHQLAVLMCNPQLSVSKNNHQLKNIPKITLASFYKFTFSFQHVFHKQNDFCPGGRAPVEVMFRAPVEFMFGPIHEYRLIRDIDSELRLTHNQQIRYSESITQIKYYLKLITILYV